MISAANFVALVFAIPKPAGTPINRASPVAENDTITELSEYVKKSFFSNTSAKFASVGGHGMNTGGNAMLSTSFFSDSDSIHRKNSSAGEINASTASAKPMRPASEPRRRLISTSPAAAR
jgi:hypothetical protein